MAYLRNTWYVAAWSHEIDDKTLLRTILEEPVVMFRDLGGALFATSNVCPHRFAPLNLGKVVDGNIECPYHGLQFNGQGQCVYNPDGDGRIPVSSRLKTYPMVERWGAAWIWMGEPARADASLIPAFSFLTDPEHYRPVTGLLNVRANYRTINDNLMDAAHVRMVHNTSLHCEMVSKTKTVLVREDDGSIWANRLGENGAMPPIFDMMWRMSRGDYDTPMDHWAEARWHAPSLVMNNTGVTVHGRPRAEGLETKNSHFLTPETDSTTHYFWSICRDFDLDNPQLDEGVRAGTEAAFINEDEVMLHAIQAQVGHREFWSMQPKLMQADVGLVALRRALDKLIDAEQAGAQAPHIEAFREFEKVLK